MSQADASSFDLTTLPSPADVHLALEASQQLTKLASGSHQPVAVELKITRGNKSEVIRLPAAAVQVLRDVMAELAKGSSVAVLPHEAELSTQQAADILNVSRPFLIELLEQGKIPFRKVGSHRRVRLLELLDFKRQNDTLRAQALAELAAQAQELGMGY